MEQIDAAKSLVGSFAKSASGPRHLGHIAIPTTLSAAECTHIAGTTSTDGVKRTAKDPVFMPSVILYDSSFALHTPHELFLSTGIRALDHAVELQYNSHASEAPCKALCLSAIADLFHYLPKYKADPTNRNVVSKCQLAAFNSLIGMGLNTSPGGLGLSHSLGYELGSPFGIPHGFTSCLTLPKIVRLRIETDQEAATNIARVASILGINGHAGTDEAAHAVADAIEGLIRDLGLQRRLQDWNVSSNDVQGIAKGMNLGDLEDKVHGIIISLL